MNKRNSTKKKSKQRKKQQNYHGLVAFYYTRPNEVGLFYNAAHHRITVFLGHLRCLHDNTVEYRLCGPAPCCYAVFWTIFVESLAFCRLYVYCTVVCCWLYSCSGDTSRPVLPVLSSAVSTRHVQCPVETTCSLLQSLPHCTDRSSGRPHSARLPSTSGLRREDRSRSATRLHYARCEVSQSVAAKRSKIRDSHVVLMSY